MKNPKSALSLIDRRRFASHYFDASWGGSIMIMGKNGKSFARVYWFHDEEKIIYLDWLSVEESARRQGIGTELQEIREKIGIFLGAKESWLWVVKDTWMHDWYRRRGYKDKKKYDGEENAIWMKKVLK